ncbi:ORF65 [Betabaculovirus altermyunipunctae]|uniref:ORF65 n=1 Tax=Betabaculovirus altermyunipunctae TaxID=3051996 RepID=A0A1S5YDY9_9BBAC|nr:ORF65 [Betabaculovirus altermyunipunctae]AQQ80332.1 ORF65 [Betabaculovirus altermyunipunctae]
MNFIKSLFKGSDAKLAKEAVLVDELTTRHLLDDHFRQWSRAIKIDFIEYCLSLQSRGMYAVDYAFELWTQDLQEDPRDINTVIKRCHVSVSDAVTSDALACIFMYNEFLSDVRGLLDNTLTPAQTLRVVVEKHAEYSAKNCTTSPTFEPYVRMVALTQFRRYYNLLDFYVYHQLQQLYPTIKTDCYLYWFLVRNDWAPYATSIDHIAPIVYCERMEFLNALKGLAINVDNDNTIDEPDHWSKYATFNRRARGLRLLDNYLTVRFNSDVVRAAEAVYNDHNVLVDEEIVSRFAVTHRLPTHLANELLFTVSNLIYLVQ